MNKKENDICKQTGRTSIRAVLKVKEVKKRLVNRTEHLTNREKMMGNSKMSEF